MYFISYHLFETETQKQINSGVFTSTNLEDDTIFTEMDNKSKLELDVAYSVVFNFVNLVQSESGSGIFTFMKNKRIPQFAQFSKN